MDEKPFVTCKRIVKAYRVAKHEIVALRGIDFEMQRGEMVAIIGASCSGKSTLMNILGCLDRPSAGSYRIAGRDTREL